MTGFVCTALKENFWGSKKKKKLTLGPTVSSKYWWLFSRSAYLPTDFIFTRLCFPGQVLKEGAEQPCAAETLCDNQQVNKLQHLLCWIIGNPNFGNVLRTFCSAGSSTLISGSDGSAPSLRSNVSSRVCVFAWAGTHVCFCVGGKPTLYVQLLLSPLSTNFFSLSHCHSWRPTLQDPFSSFTLLGSSYM